MINELIEASENYSRKFDKSGLPAQPSKRVAVITCMDSRILPERLLGLEEGDAHVIRNAGGRAAEAIRSLIISQRFLDTNEVMLIQHTDCGMAKYSNQEIRAKVEEDLGVDAGDIDILAFSDVEQNVRDDVALLNESPLIAADTAIRGFVYDVSSGKLTEVES